MRILHICGHKRSISSPGIFSPAIYGALSSRSVAHCESDQIIYAVENIVLIILKQPLNINANFLSKCHGRKPVGIYFLLASGNLFLQKLVRVLPRFQDKRIAVTIVRQIEKDISLYLLTVTMINAGLGVAVGTAMYGLGMPNPVLWGVMAGCFNFIPYLGAIASAIVLTLVASLTFDQLGRILLVPVVFIALNELEGMIVTPAVVGKRLSLNPVAIFIWLLLWGPK